MFDFDRPESIAASFREAAPWLVVNAAAYTAVDAAENDAEAAYRANRDGPARLARLCAAAGMPLIHISTDYVFDGAKGAPYVETDPVAPTRRLRRQQAGRRAGGAGGVPADGRAAHLVGLCAGGKNFVRTMLTLGRDARPAARGGRPAGLPDHGRATSPPRSWRSRRGSPTPAGEDAYAGVFHAAGTGWTTWHGLAAAMFEEAARHGAPVPRVEPITTADWPTPAKRPADSRLDCGKLAAVFGVRLPEWRPSLRRTIDAIFQ